MKTLRVRNLKTGQEGHIFHEEGPIIPTKLYNTRFQRLPGFCYSLKPTYGKDLEIIVVDPEFVANAINNALTRITKKEQLKLF